MTPHQQTFIYKHAAGCSIAAEVFRPKTGTGASSAPVPAFGRSDNTAAPVIMFIHGGALIGGGRHREANGFVLPLLERGYTVVSIDYRLAPESRLPAIITDVEDAFTWVRTQGPKLFGADPDRIAVMGGSAGGFLALLMATRVLTKPRCVVSFFGYCDLTGDWLTKPDPFYCSQPALSFDEEYKNVLRHAISEVPPRGRGQMYRCFRQQGNWVYMTTELDPKTQIEALRAFSSRFNVKADYPPTLLLHGDADTDVPHEQSVLMGQALTAARIDHRFITLAGVGHGFMDDMTNPLVADAWRETFAFLEKRLQIHP